MISDPTFMQSNSPTQKRPRRSLAQKFMLFLGGLYFFLLACVIAYVWLFTQNRFISVATFKISRQSASTTELGFAQLALPGLTDSGSVDSQIAIGFVDSSDLLLGLEKEFKLREHYSSPKADFYFRMPANAQLETRLEYYRNHIFSHFDSETGLTLLTVDSFDPELSRKIAETLLRRTEEFINSLNQVVADHQLLFVRGELDRAEKRVKDASVEILNLQNSNNLVSPDEVITSKLFTLQELHMRRLRTETSVNSMERDSPESPRIEILRSQMRSLNEQIAVESLKLSSPEQSSLNQVLARFKELELQLEFAVKMRAGAITLLEKHRMEAMSQSKFISIIQHPYFPEDVGYPRRSYASVTILVIGILLFLILRVLVHSIQEKA